jgi:hypothetical protein
MTTVGRCEENGTQRNITQCNSIQEMVKYSRGRIDSLATNYGTNSESNTRRENKGLSSGKIVLTPSTTGTVS